MRFLHLRAVGFRNFEALSLPLDAPKTFLLGPNGQGKTNALEALHFVTALRSFRGTSATALIGLHQPEAGLVLTVETPTLGLAKVEIRLAHGHKKVLIDGTPVPKASALAGLFPTVITCSQDIELLRGDPSGRRRFMDRLLCALSGEYLEALGAYTRALASRNQLLKTNAPLAQLRAFEEAMAEPATKIYAQRAVLMSQLNASLQQTYAIICSGAEPVELRYAPHTPLPSPSAYLKAIEASRAKDAVIKTTSLGPHRDDLHFGILGQRALEFGSEGQQRGLVLALKLAELQILYTQLNQWPVLLADDVLNELDPVRKAAFWQALPPQVSLVATGTVLPADPHAWQIHRMANGALDAL